MVNSGDGQAKQEKLGSGRSLASWTRSFQGWQVSSRCGYELLRMFRASAFQAGAVVDGSTKSLLLFLLSNADNRVSPVHRQSRSPLCLPMLVSVSPVSVRKATTEPEPNPTRPITISAGSGAFHASCPLHLRPLLVYVADRVPSSPNLRGIRLRARQ